MFDVPFDAENSVQRDYIDVTMIMKNSYRFDYLFFFKFQDKVKSLTAELNTTRLKTTEVCTVDFLNDLPSTAYLGGGGGLARNVPLWSPLVRFKGLEWSHREEGPRHCLIVIASKSVSLESRF